MRWWTVLLIVFLVAGGYWYIRNAPRADTISPIAQIFEKPLDKYTIDNLSNRTFSGSQVALDSAVATSSAYSVFNFHFTSEGKKVTGLAHIPKGASQDQKAPVIVQLRGYVDREIFQTGEGTSRSAEAFAKAGFISLAPDFLGYGGSDMPSEDIFEERFQTYVAALNLLASVRTLPMADAQRIGIWGHSNGGQIALTVLEVLRKPLPTSLWAPVSKPFPYSILYYTDEATDRGKLIRKRLAKFEENYDVELYSLPNYLDRIVAPMQIHQGSGDDSVPQKWSDELVNMLEEKDKTINYFVYTGADHNMVGAWNNVVFRDIEFFRSLLK